MRDIDAAMVLLALANGDLVAGVAGRIFGGAFPPDDYDPADGGAVCLVSRGGNERYDALSDASIQVKSYGSTAPDAWNTYKLVYAALHEKSSAEIAFCESEIVGRPLQDPETARYYILAFFRIKVRP